MLIPTNNLVLLKQKEIKRQSTITHLWNVVPQSKAGIYDDGYKVQVPPVTVVDDVLHNDYFSMQMIMNW